MNIIKKRIKESNFDKVEIGIKGKATIELKDPITDKVTEKIEQHNTISEWVAKTHEGYIRNQAYQGDNMGFTNWFKTIVLCNTSLNIHYNTKNIDIYKPDVTGSKLKTYDNHPNIIGYCSNLSTSVPASAKAGYYDIVGSNAGRFINSTRRVFNFAANKALGTINSIYMTAGADPFTDATNFQPNFYNINLPTNINDISDNLYCKVIGKLSNNNYIIAAASSNNYLYEINPNTGYKVNTYTLPTNMIASRLSIMNDILYYMDTENSTNGTITIKKANMINPIVFDSGTVVSIQKPSGNWFTFRTLLSNGTYLYTIHSNASGNFFIARINNALNSITYFDYLTNTQLWEFSTCVLDPVDNTIQLNTYLYSGSGKSIFIKYRINPSNTNEYNNIFDNAEQIGYCSNGSGDNNFLASGIYKYNNKYYSGDFKYELFPNNFGSMLNLETPIIKDDQHSMTVTYDYTIL